MAFDEENGMDVAWNQVKVNGLPKHEKARLLSEVEILKELDHKNIIKLYHSWIVTETDEISVNFITEACAQTLKKYAAKLKTNLDLRAVKSWSRQILRGLDYLHSHDPPIVHRDLKCDNIFVNQNQGEVKIGDLGLAAALENQRTKSVIGTPEFMAPELYDEDYDERVDIYSFGMCIIELVTHEVPYQECSNPAQIYKRVTQGVRPEALDKIIDADLRSFILKCISPIEKRLNAKELMNDPFLDRTTKPKVVEKVVRAVVEEEPEVERPGGTTQFVVAKEKKEKSSSVDKNAFANQGTNPDQDGYTPRSARESLADGESGDTAVGARSAPASESGDAEFESRELGSSRPGSEKGDPGVPSFAQVTAEGASRGGSECGSESTSPTNAQHSTSSRTGGDSPGVHERGEGTGKDGHAGAGVSEHPSPSGSAGDLASEAGDAPLGGLPRAKSRLGLSSSRDASRDNLPALAEPAETPSGVEKGDPPRRKGGSLDFRVKGRILEDKTLRLRLKIGDTSGHTRTVEFPFNTDADSSYSVASEMVDELQLAQSDIRTIMNEIESEVKFLDVGSVKSGDTPDPKPELRESHAERTQAAGTKEKGQESSSKKANRSSAPDLAGGYTSGDGGPQTQSASPSSRPMTRSQSHHAAASMQPATAPVTAAVSSPPSRSASPAPATARRSFGDAQTAPPPWPTTYPADRTPPIGAIGAFAQIPPPPSPAVIEAAVEAAARAAAADLTAAGTHSPPIAQTQTSQWAPPPAATTHAISQLEQQMSLVHMHATAHPAPHQTHPPHSFGPGQTRGGAPSSTASSVISEDLAYQPIDEEDIHEEREMEQLVASQQRETADMARRHNQQMAEKREAMTRRKLERKSLLGGVFGTHGAGGASHVATASHGDGHGNSATGTAPRPIGAAGTEGVGMVAPGRPPIAKPPGLSHQGLGTGPPPPGSTPPTSPAFNATSARPSSHSHAQNNAHAHGSQPSYGAAPHAPVPVSGAPPSYPQAGQPASRAPALTHIAQAAHPTPARSLSGASASANASLMSRSMSNGSVGGGQVSSGNNSDDGKPNEKAVKQAKAKEKLMMMEASALLNLDGFSKPKGGGDAKGKESQSMKPKKEKAPPAGDANAGGQTASTGHTQPPVGSSGNANNAPTLGSEPADRCVKPTMYAPTNGSVEAYNGDIPHATGVASPNAPMHANPNAPITGNPPTHAHQTQLAQQEAQWQQQAQQVQTTMQAQQHAMQQASDGFELRETNLGTTK
jgi:WNK lysine deficient protein kinase